MLKILFAFTIAILLVHGSFSTLCYQCNGLYDDLTNATCSVVAQNDSCVLQVGYAVDTGRWIIYMDGFKENGDMPYYVKPGTGSDFFEVYWSFTNDPSVNQLWLGRYYCYADHCNQLDLVEKFITANITYDAFKLTTYVSQCLHCNGTDYDSVKTCTKSEPCQECSFTANLTRNDLYKYTNWSSDCSKFNKNFRSTSYPVGYAIIQYEIETHIYDKYFFVNCPFVECSTFQFMNHLIQNVNLIIDF